MKRITAIAIAALASLVTAGSAVAQGHTVKATVPFDFAVGNSHLPAGTYTISSADSRSSTGLLIRSDSGKIAVLINAVADGKQSNTGKLVFDKYGDQYFMREILCSNADMNMELPVSKAEKKAQQLQASLPNGNKEQIFVAVEVLLAGKVSLSDFSFTAMWKSITKKLDPASPSLS